MLVEYRIGKHVEWRRPILKQQRRTCLEKLRNIAKNLTKCYSGRDSNPRLHRYVLCQAWMGLGPSYGKGPHQLLCVGSLATLGKGRRRKFQSIRLNYCLIFIAHTYINYKCGRGCRPTIQTLIGAVWDVLALVACICERGTRGTLTEGWPPSPDAKAKGDKRPAGQSRPSLDDGQFD